MNTNLSAQVFQRTLSASFTMKVFGLVGLAMLSSSLAVFSYASIVSLIPFIASPWVSFGLLLLLIFTAKSWSQIRPINIVLFLLIGYLLGLGITPLIAFAFLKGGSVIIVKAFLATACLTVAAGVYGSTTHRDLSGISGFLMMSLIGVIIVGILQIFWPSPLVHMIVSGISVVLFSVFIAHDVNMLKHYPEDMAIEAAIGLYLSLFNLFQSVLSLMLSLNND